MGQQVLADPLGMFAGQGGRWDVVLTSCIVGREESSLSRATTASRVPPRLLLRRCTSSVAQAHSHRRAVSAVGLCGSLKGRSAERGSCAHPPIISSAISLKKDMLPRPWRRRVMESNFSGVVNSRSCTTQAVRRLVSTRGAGEADWTGRLLKHHCNRRTAQSVGAPQEIRYA